MKKQIKLNRQSSLLATIAIVFILGAFNATVAQENKSPGERYGSREPQTCTDQMAPAKGAITAALAAKYFICISEGINGQYLYLVENVKVEVGGGIPYAAIMGQRSLSEIDVKNPVYPIRGSLTKYQCHAEDARFTHSIPGRNCIRTEEPNAKGYCYKTTFGDWSCYMLDSDGKIENYFPGVPPPGGNKAAVNDNPADTKNTNQIAKTEDQPNANRDEDGFVKPDFSDLEKYFDNIRYEYDFALRRLNIVGKMKKATNPNTWLVEFYDADGATLSLNNGTILIGLDSSVGQVVKVYTNNLPTEKQMRDEVKKIVVTRKID